MISKRIVVISDLDGTLLDHQTYSFAPALPALQRLERLHIPLVLNSSKTQEEMEALRLQLGNNAPFIVENGAALIVPRHSMGNEQEQIQYFSSPHSFSWSRDELISTVMDWAEACR